MLRDKSNFFSGKCNVYVTLQHCAWNLNLICDTQPLAPFPVHLVSYINELHDA